VVCRALLLAPLGGSVLRKLAGLVPPTPPRSPTASRRAAGCRDCPPALPADRRERRCRTSAVPSSPPRSRRISSPPRRPSLPPRKHPEQITAQTFQLVDRGRQRRLPHHPDAQGRFLLFVDLPLQTA